MSFADPTHLLAALGVPLLVALWAVSRRRRRRHAVRHPAAGALAAALGTRPRWRRVLPAALLGLSALGLSAAYAKPQRTVQVPIEQGSVVLVSDESGSMLAADVAPSRLQAAQAAAQAFLKAAPAELQIGFASFATAVRTNVAPTTDRAPVRGAIASLQADGGTATGDALTAALDQLAARKGTDGRRAPAAIVLLSDGATTAGSDPLAAADRAKQLAIPISTVALGTDQGTVSLPDGQTIAVPPDPSTLAQIAQRSGGRSYEVADADTLDGVYRDLGSKLGTRPEQREVTLAWVGGSVLLLVGGLGAGVLGRGQLV